MARWPREKNEGNEKGMRGRIMEKRTLMKVTRTGDR